MKLKFNRFCNKDRKTLMAVFLIQIYPEMLLNKFSKNLHSNKCRWEALMLIRSPMAIIHEHQLPHRLSQTLHPAPRPRSVNSRQTNLQPKFLPQAGPMRRRRSRKILPTFRTSAKAWLPQRSPNNTNSSTCWPRSYTNRHLTAAWSKVTWPLRKKATSKKCAGDLLLFWKFWV